MQQGPWVKKDLYTKLILKLFIDNLIFIDNNKFIKGDILMRELQVTGGGFPTTSILKKGPAVVRQCRNIA